jgi:polar amino acid transport system substrate-binding protein
MIDRPHASRGPLHGLFAGLRSAFVGVALLAGGAIPALAQTSTPRADAVPTFWDPQRRMERPDTSSLRIVRFVTEDDYPPFDFTAPDGSLTGFNVDLARAVCDELKLSCTVQPRRWDTILDSLSSNTADAAVASLAITPRNRERVDFTAPYYRTPGRFLARRDLALADMLPETLAGKTVGVVSHSAHEAYLRAFFPRTIARPYDNMGSLRSALKRNEVQIAFTDGIASAIWLAGTDSGDCCGFRGGPFTESRFFGEGVGIAVRKDNVVLRRALDYALKRLAERGVYTDIYLKYFPVGFY